MTTEYSLNYKFKPGENMLCTEISSDIQNKSAKRRASDKDLPVHIVKITSLRVLCLCLKKCEIQRKIQNGTV